MISGPWRIFCEGIISGLNQTEAYLKARPTVTRGWAKEAGWKLMKRPEIQTEIAALRAKSDALAGSAVMTLTAKRKLLARAILVNATTFDPKVDGDLLNYEVRDGKVRLRLMDKATAIKLDNDLAGDGAEAESNDALGDMLKRIMLESAKRRGMIRQIRENHEKEKE
ncbi:MAG TPA: terminase small subunit [Chthoniobacteraceae bacterium]|jgi:hypothetical protein